MLLSTILISHLIVTSTSKAERTRDFFRAVARNAQESTARAEANFQKVATADLKASLVGAEEATRETQNAMRAIVVFGEQQYLDSVIRGWRSIPDVTVELVQERYRKADPTKGANFETIVVELTIQAKNYTLKSMLGDNRFLWSGALAEPASQALCDTLVKSLGH